MENDTPSPLVVIREKEIELAGRLADAKQAAERAIFDARKWAASYRDQAEREAQVEAAAFFRAELAAAEAEEDNIRAAGERAAVELAEHGRLALDQVVERILEIVLPPLDE